MSTYASAGSLSSQPTTEMGLDHVQVTTAVARLGPN